MQAPMLLGGPGCVVQIDVSVMVQAMYRRDRNRENLIGGYLAFTKQISSSGTLPLLSARCFNTPTNHHQGSETGD